MSPAKRRRQAATRRRRVRRDEKLRDLGERLLDPRGLAYPGNTIAQSAWYLFAKAQKAVMAGEPISADMSTFIAQYLQRSSDVWHEAHQLHETAMLARNVQLRLAMKPKIERKAAIYEILEREKARQGNRVPAPSAAELEDAYSGDKAYWRVANALGKLLAKQSKERKGR
jgi:hypothetical protein